MVSLEKGFDVMSDHSKGDKHAPPEELDRNSAAERYEKDSGTGFVEDEERSRSVYVSTECEGEMEGNNNFCSSPSHLKEKNSPSDMETHDSLPSEIPSMTDANWIDRKENNSDVVKPASPAHDRVERESSLKEQGHVFHVSKDGLEQGEAVVDKTENPLSSSRLDRVDEETEIGNVGEKHHSDLDSPHGIPEHSIQRSPFAHQLPGRENPLIAEGCHDLSHSPTSHSQKHFSLSEGSNLQEGVISHDQSLLSVMQTCTSFQGSIEGSGHGERRKGSASDHSSPEHQRKEKSVSPSQSPVMRRDSRSPVRQRDTQSPVERRDSRSPVSGRDVQSPVRRRDSRSRVRRRDSRSPVRRRDSRSPVRCRDSRSPVRRRDSRSPVRRRDSRSPVRRRDSRSPVRRRDSRPPIRSKDSSSGYGRSYHARSRSRSPYRRYQYRRSPGRYSPRRRSPVGHHSRHRSPRRRPWSPPSNRKNGLGKHGKILFVAGFSFLTTERDLERKFSEFGHIRDVRIVRDKRSGDSRGFGFLSMRKDEEADAAIRALDETEWNGRIILVEKSKTSG